jgi:uncharacterized protein
MKMRIPYYFAALIAISLTSCVTAHSNNSQIVTIGDIQGCSHKSPFNGRFVQNIKGVVTHKFTNGFTMQSLSSDSRDCTSDAIFVTTGEYPNVMPGQLILVDGVVAEYKAGSVEDHNLSRTEIHQPKITVLSENSDFPDPVKIGEAVDFVPSKWIKQSQDFDISNNGLDYYESLEFMLVEVDDGIVVGPKNDYNEFIVLPNSFIDKNTVCGQGALLNYAIDENPEKIMVDAASSFNQDANVGDELSDPIIGIMDYSFGNFKIWTITDPVMKYGNYSPGNLEIDENSLTIATYNLENYSRYDDPSHLKKIGCQIVKDLKSPDILVLNEVLDDSGTQDDGVLTSQQTLELLIKSITNCGGPVYAYSDNPPKDNQDGGITGGNIRTCVLYREDNELILEKTSQGVNGLTNKNNVIQIQSNPLRVFSNNETFFGTRKPTIWLFKWKGEQFLIIGTHLVSQSANTPDWGDIHPIGKPEQIKRESQMNLINNYLLQQNLLDKKTNIVILGDFNDYPWSDSIKILKQNQDLIFLNNSDETESFSYIHEGNAFQFDYIVVSQNLRNRITQFVFPHINTIYNSNDQVSDHDPVMVEISEQK